MYEFEIMLHKQVYVSAYIMVIALCNGQVCVCGVGVGVGGGGRGRSTRGLNPTLSTGLHSWIYYAYKVFLGIGTSVNGYGIDSREQGWATPDFTPC